MLLPAKKEKTANKQKPSLKCLPMPLPLAEPIRAESITPNLTILREKREGPLTKEMRSNGRFDSESARNARKKRIFYGKHAPKLHCNNCSYTTACQFFKPDYVCAFENLIREHSIKGPEDIAHYLIQIAEADVQRAQLALIQERLSGNQITSTANSALERANSRLMSLYGLLQGEKEKISVHSRPVPAVQNLQAIVNPPRGEDAPGSGRSILRDLVLALQSSERTLGGE